MSSRFAMIVLLFAALDAHSAILTVGPPPCTHATLALAFSDAEMIPGPDVIRLRRSGVFNNVGLVKTSADELTIEGGYASCTSTLATGITRLDGAGSHRSVISLRRGSLILRDLLLTGGAPTDGLGGGVRASGNYQWLQLEQVTINASTAMNGGGLYVDGTSATQHYSVSATHLRVEGNSAKVGGGIFLRGVHMEVTGLGVSNNLAYRDGGGLFLENNAFLYVHAGSYGDSAISNNRADRDGGGALVRNGALLALTNTDAKSKEMSISGNTAGKRGGAVSIQNSVAESTSIFITNGINLIANRAPLGAVYSADANAPATGEMAQIFVNINSNTWPGVYVPCTPASRCDIIAWNNAMADDGTPGIGAVGHHQAVGRGVVRVAFAATTIMENRGYDLFDVSTPGWAPNEPSSLELLGSLIVHNQTSGPLVESIGDNTIHLWSSTVTENDAGAEIFRPGSYLNLSNSIIHERSQAVVGSFDQLVGEDVLVADPSGLPDFPGLLVGDPRFVDPTSADYHLSPYSIAIDRAPGVDSAWLERDHLLRSVDLPEVVGPGKQDLGCYELQKTP